MGNDYIFASSRVRSVEKNLLTREKAERMIDSKTPEDALKILYELEYASSDGSELNSAKNFDVLLAEETKKTYDFIKSIAADEKDFYTFFYSYDYHNLKVILKAEALGIDAQVFLIPAGTIPEAKLLTMVKERNLAGVTATMKEAVMEAVEVFARTNNPQMIDFILDKACYRDMLQAAKTTGNRYLEGYVVLLIDTINLKTFVRMREMGQSWDDFSKVFLDGGHIQQKLFISNYDESYEQFADRLLPYNLNVAMAEGGAQLREAGRFTTLERLCDDEIMHYAESAKYVSFGMEPLAAYIIAKESDIRNVRIIMAGLLQGLSREMIKERQREVYV